MPWSTPIIPSTLPLTASRSAVIAGGGVSNVFGPWDATNYPSVGLIINVTGTAGVDVYLQWYADSAAATGSVDSYRWTVNKNTGNNGQLDVILPTNGAAFRVVLVATNPTTADVIVTGRSTAVGGITYMTRYYLGQFGLIINAGAPPVTIAVQNLSMTGRAQLFLKLQSATAPFSAFSVIAQDRDSNSIFALWSTGYTTAGTGANATIINAQIFLTPNPILLLFDNSSGTTNITVDWSFTSNGVG